MASDREFPVPCREEMENFHRYFDVQSNFTAAKNFLTAHQNLLRKHAVSVIAKCCRTADTNVYVAYLAMNYFDRYVSKDQMSMKDVEGASEEAKLNLLAISCFTLSSQELLQMFDVSSFLSEVHRRGLWPKITKVKVRLTEYFITREFDWKLVPVTAFCFLNMYNLLFKQFGSFKPRCINEIIVQAQGEDTFIHYLPSDIALSAFLTAAQIAFPSKYEEIAETIQSKIGLYSDVKECTNKMVVLCKELNIQIEISDSSEILVVPEEESKEVGTSEIKEIQQNSSEMAVEIIQRHVRKTETSHLLVKGEELSDKKDISAEAIEAKRRRYLRGKAVDMTEIYATKKRVETMNFKLKWPIDVPSLDKREHRQPQESTTIRLKIPGTGMELKVGCCSCNIS